MIPQNKLTYQNLAVGNSKRTSIQNRPSIFQTTKSQRNSSRVKFKQNSPDYSMKLGDDKNIKKQEQYQKSESISILDSPRSSAQQINTNQVQLNTRLTKNGLVMTSLNKNRNTLNLNTQTNTLHNVNNNPSQNHTDQQIAYAEKVINVGLANSIPLFGKRIEKSQIIQQQRKYKIFAQNRIIKFEIPPLEEYYSKENYKGTVDFNGNMSINDQASINKQLNGSNYSFLDFMNYDKMKNTRDKNLDGTLKGSYNGNIGLKNLKTMKSRHFESNQYKDSIKECSQEDKSMSRINSALTINAPSTKQIPQGKQGLKIRVLYSLFGFILAMLILIIINHFL